MSHQLYRPGLLDDRSPVSVRHRIGMLLTDATTADFAVTRIRLAALDLTRQEVAEVGRCRVLLGHLDAGTLLDAAEGPGSPAAADGLGVLIDFARSGRLQVRAAGMAGWEPDFSIFRGYGVCALLGGHYFGSPHPIVGPTFTAMITANRWVRKLESRFEEVWGHGHDVLPAVLDVLEKAHGMAVETGG